MEFEKSVARLDEIVKKMEDKNTTLGESLKLFDEGVKLSEECIKTLNETRGKVNLITSKLKAIEKLEVEFDNEGNFREI